jgi:SAM-dependent methyltransferase
MSLSPLICHAAPLYRAKNERASAPMMNCQLGDPVFRLPWMNKTPGSFDVSAHDALREVEDRSFWFRHRNRVVAELLRRYPIVGTFADVGGGNGCLAAHLASVGHNVVVVEPGEGGCHHARARGLQVCQSTIEESPFGANSLGAVGAFDVVEHLPAARSFLDECRQRLIPGGRIFITVPAYQWLWSGADIEAGHVCRYTRKTLRSLVEASGFRVDFTSYLFLICIPGLALMRALPYRLGQRRNIIGRLEQDHAPGGITQRWIEHILSLELTRIARGRTVLSGTSVVLVATRAT